MIDPHRREILPLFDSVIDEPQEPVQVSPLDRAARAAGYSSYANYLQSPQWAARRQEYLGRFPQACFVCGVSLGCHLHHISYDNFPGNEEDADLVWLCEAHHEMAHSLIGRLGDAHVVLQDAPENEIKSVRDWMEPFLQTGIICPCCGAMTKVYRRKLNCGMAVALIRLHRMKLSEDGWLHVTKDSMSKHARLDLHHGEYSKLLYWGLLERQCSGNNAQPEAGKWRVTPIGAGCVVNCGAELAHTAGGSLRNHRTGYAYWTSPRVPTELEDSFKLRVGSGVSNVVSLVDGMCSLAGDGVFSPGTVYIGGGTGWIYLRDCCFTQKSSSAPVVQAGGDRPDLPVNHIEITGAYGEFSGPFFQGTCLTPNLIISPNPER